MTDIINYRILREYMRELYEQRNRRRDRRRTERRTQQAGIASVPGLDRRRHYRRSGRDRRQHQ